MTTRLNMIALESAKILLETKSVLINAAQPFTYTSGKQGPVYVDIRRLISFPEARTKLMNFAAEILADIPCDFVAGGETAGIPYAAFIAERLNKPMLYVRKKPKGFGRNAQIEGALEQDGQNVILIEDLQTDGGSKKVFVDALREAGARIEHAFVVFHYGNFPQSYQNMKDWGLTLHALTTWKDVIAVARREKYFDTATLSSVEDFLSDPVAWQERRAQSAS
jgi:orotate phosphoribosyltransferase